MMMRTRGLTRLAVALVAALSMVLVACGGGGDGGDTGGTAAEATDGGDGGQAGGELTAAGPIADVDLSGVDLTVGSKNFTEQLVLGHITLHALEATGADVTDEVGLAGTNAARQALTAGEIDLYWDYNGTGWIVHLGNEGSDLPDDLTERVAQADLEQNGIHWYEPAPFNNTYALAYREEFSVEGNPLETLSDYADLVGSNPEQASLCVETEFQSRDDGLPGMAETYGFSPDAMPVSLLEVGAVYTATDRGNPCNFGEVFTSDGRIASLGLTVLEDDMGFFPPYNPSVTARQEVHEANPEATETLFNSLAAALDLETMQQLNARVDAEGENPSAVALDWLRSSGFVG